MEGQKVSVSVMGLKQDVTSGMEWVPNDLEENQIRSVLEETCGNKTVSGLCTQRFVYSEICVFQNYQKNENKISLGHKKTSLEEQ